MNSIPYGSVYVLFKIILSSLMTETIVLDLYIFSSVKSSFSVIFSVVTKVVQFIRKLKGIKGSSQCVVMFSRLQYYGGRGNTPGKYTLKTFL